MRLELEGPWPAWVRHCNDQVLLARVGPGPLSRGNSYARQRAVLTLSLREDGDLLTATVRGSGRSTYQTAIRPQTSRHGAHTDFAGRCSCPMQIDCKHVAAVLITARDQAGRGPAAVVAPAWESRFAELVRPAPPPSTLAPLAYQFEVVTSASRQAEVPAERVRLRPVTVGKTGRWVRTGVSWLDLEYGYALGKIQPEHRALAREVLAAYRSSPQTRVASYHDPQIHLDDLGPQAWRMLADAQRAGIALVATKKDQRVTVTLPGAVVLDVTQPSPGQPVDLSFAFRLSEHHPLPSAGARLVGRPAHGAYLDTPDQLLLVPFEQALDSATHNIVAAGALQIPASELPVFVKRYYPRLRQRITVESSDLSVAFPEVRPPHLALTVTFEAGHETRLDWSFAYPVGDDVVHARGADDPVARDRAAEAALLAALPDVPGLWVDDAGRRHLTPQTQLTGMGTALFVRDVLPVLNTLPDLTVELVGTPVAYEESPDGPRISVSTHDSQDGSTDWFDLGIDVSVSGQDVPLATLFSALAQQQEHLILPSGTWFGLDRPELEALRRLVEEARSLQDKESTGLRLTAFHAGLWEELVSLGVVEHQSARWASTVSGLLELDQLPRPEQPASLQATLRPYQLEGYQWLSLLWDHQLGGILADDMGLGKTVQTLAMIARAHELGTLDQPLLVVAPTSVVGTWASEAAKFAPGLSVVAITETERRSGRRVADAAARAQLVVTSYALFRIDEDAYQDVGWSGLILDEAQFVKNHQARTYQCARRLPAPFKLAITGTPLENSLMDLWSMLSITAPGLFPNPQRFTELFRRPIESGQSPEQLAVLRRRIRPLMLRRTKEQVATDLPPKIEQVLHVELNPQHRKVYDKHLARERQRILGLLDDLQRNRIAILRSLTVLRQLSLDASLVDDAHAGKIRSSKIDVLLDQLREVVDEGHRVLVFSQFTGFLALVKARLDEEGIGYCYLDGRTRNRPARIAEFTDGDAPVFLISLKAGGVGLTLTEADYVFVLDPWWNPAAEAQAVDRAHRIGQSKTVMVYRLVATDTIEEKVVALQQRKRDLFAAVVNDDAMTGGAMTAEDIRGLFA